MERASARLVLKREKNRKKKRREEKKKKKKKEENKEKKGTCEINIVELGTLPKKRVPLQHKLRSSVKKLLNFAIEGQFYLYK
jgi:hypothetical protein